MTSKATAKIKSNGTQKAISHQLVEYSIDEIATLQQGYTFSPDRQGRAEGKWPYVKVGDLNAHGNTKYIDRTLNYVGDDVLAEMRARPFASGSIVFPRVGAALRANNKRILRYQSLADDNVIVVTVRDDHVCSPEYLYYWFDFQDMQRFCNDGTVPVINGKSLKRQRVLLPGIDRQRQIADLLSAWDIAVHKMGQLIVAKEKKFLSLSAQACARKSHWTTHRLGDFFTEARRIHGGGEFEIGSIGKHGLRPRNEIYSKDLSVSYDRNALVERGWICFGLASDTMAYGINLTERVYSVSPAYKTYQINGVDHRFIDCYLRVNNKRLSKRFLVTSARQGKAIDFDGLFKSLCYFPPISEQEDISASIAAFRDEIEMLRKLYRQYKLQKRGLLKLLLAAGPD